MMMTPALGFFEAGLLRSKNSISVIMQTFTGLAILSALWFILGFSMVYGTSQSGIVGGSDFIFFNNIPLRTRFHLHRQFLGSLLQLMS
jgi:Amt family ammonium transporter